jgi:hypothetical protein
MTLKHKSHQHKPHSKKLQQTNAAYNKLEQTTQIQTRKLKSARGPLVHSPSVLRVQGCKPDHVYQYVTNHHATNTNRWCELKEIHRPCSFL